MARVKLGRTVLPMEIAQTLLFLGSDDSLRTTGQRMVVDVVAS